MYGILKAILDIIGVYGIFMAFAPNILPASIKEFFHCYFNAEVKAYRIIYPALFLCYYLNLRVGGKF